MCLRRIQNELDHPAVCDHRGIKDPQQRSAPQLPKSLAVAGHIGRSTCIERVEQVRLNHIRSRSATAQANLFLYGGTRVQDIRELRPAVKLFQKLNR
ncbi:hypothetical protein D3C86_1934430 [compost metagenome]